MDSIMDQYGYISMYGSTVLCWALVAFSFSCSYMQSVGLLGRGISPSHGRYLHTGQHQHRINAHRHPCLEWDSNQRYQCSRERREFIPQTARPLWSAVNTAENWNFPTSSRSRDSSVSIATGYGLDDRGVGFGAPLETRIFSSPRRPDRLWSPPNLLSNVYRGLFLQG
jgi:hypothetical protein